MGPFPWRFCGGGEAGLVFLLREMVVLEGGGAGVGGGVGGGGGGGGGGGSASF